MVSWPRGHIAVFVILYPETNPTHIVRGCNLHGINKQDNKWFWQFSIYNIFEIRWPFALKKVLGYESKECSVMINKYDRMFVNFVLKLDVSKRYGCQPETMSNERLFSCLSFGWFFSKEQLNYNLLLNLALRFRETKKTEVKTNGVFSLKLTIYNTISLWFNCIHFTSTIKATIFAAECLKNRK